MAMAIDRKTLAGMAIGALALGGCATRAPELASSPPPVVVTPLAPMPQPPVGTRDGMAVPARLADGSYATPNHGLSGNAAIWHLRVALNVAALGCRGAEGTAITSGYNAMLSRAKAELAVAGTAAIKAEGGQAGYDETMTRLYNYFAQPGAQAAFCTAAATVTTDLATAPALGSAAAPALAALDQPFVDLYRSYDAYRTQLAAWQADRLQRASQPLDMRPRTALAPSAPAVIGATPHLTVDPTIFRQP
jgi:hypothetical protein